MTRGWRVIIIPLMLGAIVAGCLVLGTEKPAKPIVGTDGEGNALQLSDYRGKVVLLKFWRST
jgi:hypothetical protein